VRISVIQTQRRFSYDPQQPGEYDKARCTALAQATIDEGFEMMDRAGRQGGDLLVTIEAFNASIHPLDPRYKLADVAEPLDGPLMERFRRLARRHAVHVVAGLYTLREGRVYNSAVLFAPDGALRGIHDKVHMPGNEGLYITPGDSYSVFETEHGVLGMLVCWDLQYPEAARELALAGADLIAVPTWGWEKLYGLCRAYENGVTIAAAMGIPHGGELWSFCDPSCIVDNMGRVVAEAERSGSQIVTADVDICREPAPQYGAGAMTGMASMRQIRMAQRRPDTYCLITSPHPPLYDRYDTVETPRRLDINEKENAVEGCQQE
jgi:predicted amidohydrolase